MVHSSQPVGLQKNTELSFPNRQLALGKCYQHSKWAMEANAQISFHEEQQFKRPWLIVLVVIGMLLPIGILVSGLTKEKLNAQELTLSLIAIIVVEIPLFVLFYLSRLEIIITKEGMGYRWWPLQKKYRMMLKNDIVEIKTRKSPAFTYGYHWVPGFGWVNNVRAGIGFQIKLKSGKKLFLGTERLAESKAALEKLLNTRIGEFRNEF